LNEWHEQYRTGRIYDQRAWYARKAYFFGYRAFGLPEVGLLQQRDG
jgi:hypothetical protein